MMAAPSAVDQSATLAHLSLWTERSWYAPCPAGISFQSWLALPVPHPHWTMAAPSTVDQSATLAHLSLSSDTTFQGWPPFEMPGMTNVVTDFGARVVVRWFPVIAMSVSWARDSVSEVRYGVAAEIVPNFVRS